MIKLKPGFYITIKQFGNPLQVLVIIIPQSSEENIIHLSQVLKQFKVNRFLSNPEENRINFYLKIKLVTN